MGTILEQPQTGNRTSTSFLQSILIKQCALRDYSAQEAMWLLMGFPLMRCSKQFKILNLADDSFLPFEEGDGEFVSNDPETVYGNRIQRFRIANLNREALQEVEQMSMYEFFSTYFLRTATASTFSRYRNAPVLRIFPRPNSADVHGNISDQFCKLQLKLPVSWSGRFEESVNPGRRLWVEIYREHSEQILFGFRFVCPSRSTGSAAALIGGQTIHSKLIIGINRNLNSLSDRQLTELQENLRGCQFIIIDEMSLVGCSWLKKIDIRCREAKGVDLPFGNMFLVLLGDIKQLPPILDRAFYGTGFNSEYSIAGQQPYRNIECSVILPTSFLQNDEQAEFRQLLDRLADGRTTIADWNSLSTRCLDQINAGDFANSLRLFDTVDKVQEYNQQKLREFDSVYRCLATNSSSLAARTPSRDADNLENVLYLAFNCRVMLRRNLWAVAGLVNGSLGTVTDIVVSPDHEMPVFVMVRFDHYLGPILDGSVPIQPVQGSWISNEQQCTRIQLPLSVARVRTFFLIWL